MTQEEIIKVLRDMAKYPTVTLPRDSEALKAAADLLAQPDQYAKGYADAMNWKVQNHLEHLPTAQPDRYITDAMRVRQAVAQALIDDVYAKELEQPEAKQSGTISITAPAPIAYLCENAVGHKYFRWKKPSSVYKPIPLYTTPPQRTWVGLTDDERDHLAGLHLYAMKRQVEASIEGVDDFAKAIEAKLKEKNT
jgi:hypothetical protein